ncbi:MAG TPA: SsrA-binding protein SmpB [Gemmatimonadota bacterium]|nr:SsrA-binding protein SmpB [Gemmatimonadota bacterium]
MTASEDGRRVVLRNRKARHEYEILDTFEAGLVLRGAEVKSLRDGSASFTDAFARIEDGEAWLYNLHITPWESATVDAPDPKRTRKLLLHGHEIDKLAAATQQKGLTLVPLDLYFRRGHAKVTLALAKGKKLHDKRETLRREAMRREAERAMEKYRG